MGVLVVGSGRYEGFWFRLGVDVLRVCSCCGGLLALGDGGVFCLGAWGVVEGF
jgi:hypothetical protein